MSIQVTNPTPDDVVRAAKTWNMRLTRQQAESLLERNSTKINRAMRQSALEVLKEQVDNFCLDQEDQDLK